MGVSYKLGQSKRLRGLLVEASSGAPLIPLIAYTQGVLY